MIIYLTNEPSLVKTQQGELLNLNNKICMIKTKNSECIYFKLISGIRLQQDSFNNKKFYLTDEKNKWHGIISDGSFCKGRYIYVF